MIPPSQLSEWSAAAEKATEGPWYVRTLENFGWNVVQYRDGDKFDIQRVAKSSAEEDAAFIALSREAVPALIAEVRRLSALQATPSVPTEGHGTTVLADIIRKSILGVRPDDQAVVLEDDDWRLILASLDRPSGAPDRPRR